MDKARLQKILQQLSATAGQVLATARKLLKACGHAVLGIYQLVSAQTRYYAPIVLHRLRTLIRIGYQYAASICQSVIRACCLALQCIREWLRTHWPAVQERLYQYALLARLHRPIGIFLLLWPTLWALWFAATGVPDMYILLVFVTGVVAMRSAGCVVNDIADRHFDAHVTRTRDRPLVTGKVTLREAIMVASMLVLLALLLVLTLDPLTIKLSFIGAALAVLYPFTKRYTYLPQVFLGLAFGWAVPMAFAAVTGSVSLSGWILFMATVLWAVAYDTEYAMVDREDDIRMGVKSTAILFEDADRAIIGLIQILVLLALALAGGRQELGWIYYMGLAAAAVSAIYQQYLIKDRIPGQCFRAFLNNNVFGAAIFAGIFLHYQFY